MIGRLTSTRKSYWSRIWKIAGVVVPAAVVCFSIMLCGCKGGKKQAAGPVAAVILMQEDQFFRLNEAGMRDAAKANGIEMLVGNAYGKIDNEVNLIETYVAKGVNAILISPLSTEASIPALKKARDAGVKVVLYNSDMNADDIADFSITSDQVSLGSSSGEAAKKYITEKLGGKANVAIIAFVSQSLEQGPLRPKGFMDAIKDMPGVKVVAQQDAWIAHKATETVETILGAHPDLNIVWAANEGGTVGAVMAVNNAGKAGKVAVFGTDISEQLTDYLLAEDNVLQAVTAQKPYEMGFAAMEGAVKILKGEQVQKKNVLTGTLFSRDNPEVVKGMKVKLAELTK